MTALPDRDRELANERSRAYRRRRREGVLVVAKVELVEKEIDTLHELGWLDGEDYEAAIKNAIEAARHFADMCRIFRAVTEKP